MEKLVSILASNPLVTLLVAAVLILVFMFLFKDTIKKYLVKKFDLYDEVQMKDYAEYHKTTKKFVGNSEGTLKNWKTNQTK
jgi:predicted PurR-regulated permease PerM